MKFSTLFHLYVHHELFFERFYILTLPALIYIAFGVLLWRPYAGVTFKINEKIKSRTLLVAMVAGIVGMIVA